MVETLRNHPLCERRFATNGVSLKPAEACERLSLRAGPDACAELGKALGVKLPTKPKTSASAKNTVALWLGPDEWLLFADAGTDLAGSLEKLDSVLYSAVDVSHRNTAILIEGSKAASILNAGCPQDLSLSTFGVGACSRTVLGKSEIVLYRTASDRFRVECWRSFSDYVWNYLADAATSS